MSTALQKSHQSLVNRAAGLLTGRHSQASSRHNDLGDSADVRLKQLIKAQELPLYRYEMAPLYGVSDGREFDVIVQDANAQGQLVDPFVLASPATRQRYAQQWDRLLVAQTLASAAVRSARTCALPISSYSIADPDYPDFVNTAVNSENIVAGTLCFKIDEADIVANLPRAAALIGALQQIGARVAVDHFGHSMSTFTALQSLSLDCIRIDESLVRDMVSNRLHRSIITAISEIGQVMGAEVMAPGVEDDVTVGRLRSIGAELIQGHYISKPEPLDQLSSD